MSVVRKLSAKKAVDIPQENRGENKVVEGVVRGAEKKSVSRDDAAGFARPKKVCYFCKSKSVPRYWDAATLRKQMNDRGRISPRQRVGTCAKHQRSVSREIKRARHLALLPFTVRV